EDIYTGAKAAAAGGYTSVVMMANTKPTIDNVETLKYVLEKGKETDINVYACANVTYGMKGEELTDFDALAKCGAVGFTDDGIPLVKEEIVLEAMKKSRALDLPLSFHEEDPAVIENNGINKGKASEYFGIGGSPRDAEINMIRRDIELARKTGAAIDIQHISTKEGVEMVRRAKAEGLKVYAEATPHHFSLTEEAAIEHGTLAKMNPPLREEADREAVAEGLADGTIDMIATDHAPHTAEEKARELTKAPSGIIGLETALPLAVMNLLNTGKMRLRSLMASMSTNPARIYKLDAGYLAEGGPADIVILDLNEKYAYKKEDIASKACNTPFIGWEMTGKVLYTICGGKVVYKAK
ncbi:MAG: dihydroorotase, partial [Lachnospiraceae bacterium]|nr:dihydroorotase [Lachnospiraceae bacterium]